MGSLASSQRSDAERRIHLERQNHLGLGQRSTASTILIEVSVCPIISFLVEYLSYCAIICIASQFLKLDIKLT